MDGSWQPIPGALRRDTGLIDPNANCKERHNAGVNVCFLDGHVKWMQANGAIKTDRKLYDNSP